MDRILTLSELLSELDKYNHNELHLHHTWKPTHKQFNGTNHLALQQGMRNTHININGWADIGQHVTLMPDGKFVTGRDFARTPASIMGYNTGAFACEMLGNFDVEGKTGTNENILGYDTLQGTQLDSALGLAKYFDDRGKYVRFHRENDVKTCPGNGIDKADFMSKVKSYGKNKLYYIITNYIPKGEWGVEINEFINKYFDGLTRVYIQSNQIGLWAITQYLSKDKCDEIANKLKADNLLCEIKEDLV